MRITQMLNCIAIAYVPYIIFYSKGGVEDIPEHSALTALGFGFYVLSQFTKICLIASGIFDLLGLYMLNEALITSLTNSIDFYYIHYAITTRSLIRSERNLRTLPIGAGWALAEIIINYIVSFIAGFRDKSFKLRYYFNAFEANSKILYNFVSSFLVIHYVRASSKPFTSMPLLVGAILTHFFFVPYFKRNIPVGTNDVTTAEWISLVFSAASDVTIAFFIKYLDRLYEREKKL